MTVHGKQMNPATRNLVSDMKTIREIEHLSMLIAELVADMEATTRKQLGCSMDRIADASQGKWKRREENYRKGIPQIGIAPTPKCHVRDFWIHVGWNGDLFGDDVWIGVTRESSILTPRLVAELSRILDGPDVTKGDAGRPYWCRIPKWPNISLDMRNIALQDLAGIRDGYPPAVDWVERKIAELVSALG